MSDTETGTKTVGFTMSQPIDVPEVAFSVNQVTLHLPPAIVRYYYYYFFTRNNTNSQAQTGRQTHTKMPPRGSGSA